MERDNFLEKEAGKLDVKAWLDFKTFRMWRLASEAFSCARCPNEPTIWINETDCAKSLADLKTSYSVTRGQVANKLRFSQVQKTASGFKEIINGDLKNVFFREDAAQKVNAFSREGMKF